MSGRSYVYQAMRISGAGDITTPIAETRAGKLPQQVISKTAAHGYSSYGNQIGLATTYVREYFHPGFVAKRMELGAVVVATVTEKPNLVMHWNGKTIVDLERRFLDTNGVRTVVDVKVVDKDVKLPDVYKRQGQVN